MSALSALLIALPATLPFGNPFAPPQPTQPERPVYMDSRDQVDVSVVAQRAQVTPGQDTAIAVIFDHQPGWHIHTHAPVVPPELGSPSDYVATDIVIDAPENGSLIARTKWIQWPEAHDVEVAFGGTPVLYGVYEGKAVAFVPVHVAADAPLGSATLSVHPVFQACDDIMCMAPTPRPPAPGAEPSKRWLQSAIDVTFDIVTPETLANISGSETEPPVFSGFDTSVYSRIASGEAPAEEPVVFNAFGWEFSVDASGLGFLMLLVIAAFGGFLLNLTPCVLPVIPIKIMALSAGSHSRQRTVALGIAMAVGVTAFWMAIGLAITLLSGFTASNQLFQYPAFSVGVGVIIAAMAVGMCGLFTLKLPDAVYMVSPKHDTLTGSFLFGIMTAVLSTPCTAPFMGAAMAWAATVESNTVTLVTFAAIGVGMALPYLVLAMFPHLTDRMPKAGPASELIKQFLGGLMLAAAAFFIGVGLSGMLAEPPEPPSRMYFWFVAAVVVASALWLGYRAWTLSPKREDGTRPPAGKWQIIGTVLSVLLCATAVFGANHLTDKGPIDWVYYQPDRFETALDEGNVVVLEFTAEWCLNCKALEKTVLASPEVAETLGAAGVVPMKVDLTGNNAEGNAMLHDMGRHQIPLLVIFAPDGSEIFKGDFYTVQQVVDSVKKAKAS